MVDEKESIVLGAGCFWCTEAVLKMFPGIKSITVGYAGGNTKDPTYEQVCYGHTGHIEVAKTRILHVYIHSQKLQEGCRAKTG